MQIVSRVDRLHEIADSCFLGVCVCVCGGGGGGGGISRIRGPLNWHRDGKS